MSALLLDIKQGDEVILPSFTFTSTASAFSIRGAKLIFIDIRPDTMNIDENLIESAITDKTKAIIVVHYAGVSCEMDKIMAISAKYGIPVVEDAAQALLSEYKGRKLGTIGQFGTISFHETKNIQCGEGGALLVNDPQYVKRAEIIREKGTNRSQFFRGEINKYGWVDIGSSYLPSELNAAFLYPQLIESKNITAKRLKLWDVYKRELQSLADEKKIEFGVIPEECVHNAHMFYIKTKDEPQRSDLITYLKKLEIYSVFHYLPLHSSEEGLRCGMMHSEDKFTTKDSERLLRFPFFFALEEIDVVRITSCVKDFFKCNQ
jgi:dTDP-4-amino-4,6-dideoxygalactose transaminase